MRNLMVTEQKPVSVDLVKTWRGYEVRVKFSGNPKWWFYVANYYKGQYVWVSDYTYAKHFKPETANKHKKRLEELKVMNDYKEEEYKGYVICFNFYGRGEYSVQFCGDDIICQTREEAMKTIDELVEL